TAPKLANTNSNIRAALPAHTYTPIPTLPWVPATNTAIPSPSPTPFPTMTPSPASIRPTLTPAVLPTHTPPPFLPTPTNDISWTVKTPIIMYHYVSTPPQDADQYRINLSIEPEKFRQQMAYLADNGFTTIDLYDLSLAITGHQPLPPKPIILTFDDGYRDNYQYAFPILQEYGHKATFFVVTEFIDLGYEAYMTWPMVEEMAAAGMRIEPHSKTHPDLNGQDRNYLIYQILGSMETVQAHIGYQPRYFAYPGGSYDEQTVEILEALNFWGAVNTQSGLWHGFDDRYEWKRIRMRYQTSLTEFAALIE
ncbi:MAG TPA: polysaccharide deacetylase family protein, partial [Anaerolineae bacterium]|nr:polysaccharide deacetylase family protein [Anaerolineae bacterium]